jgi:hypothetical protein
MKNTNLYFHKRDWFDGAGCQLGRISSLAGCCGGVWLCCYLDVLRQYEGFDNYSEAFKKEEKK